MAPIKTEYPLPRDDAEFDNLSRALFERRWGAKTVTRHGRPGQGQDGVDFLGTDRTGDICGGQSKLHGSGKKLSLAEVKKEVGKAKAFRPALSHYVISTTARTDPKIQQYVTGLSQEHTRKGLFTVVVYFWDDIVDLLDEHSDIAERFFRSPALTDAKVEILNRFDQSFAGLAQRFESLNLGGGEEIDEAIGYTKAGQPQSAVVLLERLKTKRWSALTQHERYRVLANLGLARSAMEDYQEAGRLLIEARALAPDDAKAEALQALGHLFLGQSELAHEAALRAITKAPDQPLAIAVRLKTTKLQTPFPEVEAAVPESMRAAPEVAFELAVRARMGGDFTKARSYAEATIRAVPDQFPPHEELGTILFAMASTQNCSGSSLKRDEVLSLAQSAIDEFSRAISLIREPKSPALARLRLCRSVAFELHGKSPEAEADLNVALGLCPDDPQVLTDFGYFRMEQGKFEESIGFLTRAVAVAVDARPHLALAQALRHRHRPSDMSDALKCVESGLPLLDKCALPLRHGMITTLIDLYLGEKRLPEATQALDRWRSILPHPLALVSQSKIEAAEGKANEAIASALAARDALAATDELVVGRFVAAQLGLLAKNVESLEILKRIVPRDRVSSDLYLLVDLAMRCGDDETIMSVCRSLRTAGVRERRLLDLELNTLEKYHSTDEAIRILDEEVNSAAAPADRAQAILRRSLIYARTGRPELVDYDVTHLPDPGSASPEVGHSIVELLCIGPDPISGVHAAYKVVRAHPASQLAHRAMIKSVSSLNSRGIEIPSPEQVAEDAVVKFKEESRGTEDWLLIEFGVKAGESPNEVDADHPIAKELGGRRVGERFCLRKGGLQEIFATITSISSKYVWQYLRSMDEWERRFPGEKYVTRIMIQGTDGAAAPDMTVVTKQVEDGHKAASNAIALYWEKTFPVFTLSGMLGRSIFEVFLSLPLPGDACVKTSLGTGAERSLATASLNGASGFVLDYSSAAALFASGLFEDFGTMTIPIIAPQSLLEDFVAYSHTERVNRPSGFLTRVGEQITAIPSDKDGQLRLDEKRSAFIAFLRNRCTLEAGAGAADLDTTLRGQFDALCGIPGRDALALARAPGRVLWSDDLVASGIGRETLGIRAVWSQVLFSWLAEKNPEWQPAFAKLTEWLIRSRVMYAWQTPETFAATVVRNGGDPSAASVRASIDYFRKVPAVPIPLMTQVAACMKSVFRSDVSPIRAEDIALELVSAVASRPGSDQLLPLLSSMIDTVFNLDPIRATRLKAMCGAHMHAADMKPILPPPGRRL